MSEKQMTVAEAKAALRVAAAESDAKQARRDTFLCCPKCDAFLYAGERGCRNGC